MEAARGRRLHDPAAPPDHSRRRAGHPDRRRGAPVSGVAASAGAARARRHLRAGREGAGAVRHQHRRRLHRPEFARISDPQYRPHHQPRRSAQRRGGDASNGGPVYLRQVADCRVRAQGQARRRRLHGQARGHRLGREAAERRHRRADARDRGRAARSSTPRCRRASRPTRSCSGRPTSSRPRSATSSACCSRPPSSSRSCCSRSC